MSQPPKTPAPKTKEQDYEDYGLSPPKMKKKERKFAEAMKAIMSDFPRLHLVTSPDGKVTWFSKRKYQPDVEVPHDICRIILFLYSREFHKHDDKPSRVGAVNHMYKAKKMRKIMLQVIECDGDKNLAPNSEYQSHYLRACKTIHRYFQRQEARGFVPDMSTLTYYLRIQAFGSCFLQAPCVTMSYFLQACGQATPPADASRLIRHHFDDNQLKEYAADSGGDSAGILRILDKKYCSYDGMNRTLPSICVQYLDQESCCQFAKELIAQSPGLVSKFVIPYNFQCAPPSVDLKIQSPELAQYNSWNEIPAADISPGVTRFTEWDKTGVFIPLLKPNDLEKETDLLKTWKSLLEAAKEDHQPPAVTSSGSTEPESCESQSTHVSREQSTNGTTTITEEDPNEDLWTFFDVDSDEEDGSVGSFDDAEPQERTDDDGSPLHAMVLLGHYVEDGARYWVLQNSWAGPTQVIELSTDYFRQSEACLYFLGRELRSPKDANIDSAVCASPISESSQLERSDCEDWEYHLVYPGSGWERASKLRSLYATYCSSSVALAS